MSIFSHLILKSLKLKPSLYLHSYMYSCLHCVTLLNITYFEDLKNYFYCQKKKDPGILSVKKFSILHVARSVLGWSKPPANLSSLKRRVSDSNNSSLGDIKQHAVPTSDNISKYNTVCHLSGK